MYLNLVPHSPCKSNRRPLAVSATCQAIRQTPHQMLKQSPSSLCQNTPIISTFYCDSSTHTHILSTHTPIAQQHPLSDNLTSCPFIHFIAPILRAGVYWPIIGSPTKSYLRKIISIYTAALIPTEGCRVCRYLNSQAPELCGGLRPGIAISSV